MNLCRVIFWFCNLYDFENHVRCAKQVYCFTSVCLRLSVCQSVCVCLCAKETENVLIRNWYNLVGIVLWWLDKDKILVIFDFSFDLGSYFSILTGHSILCAIYRLATQQILWGEHISQTWGSWLQRVRVPIGHISFSCSNQVLYHRMLHVLQGFKIQPVQCHLRPCQQATNQRL